METLEINANKVTIKLSLNELLILSNSMNEVCHGLRISSLEEITGLPAAEVHKMLSEIGSLHDSIDHHKKQVENEGY